MSDASDHRPCDPLACFPSSHSISQLPTGGCGLSLRRRRITQENKLGQRFIGATDFLKNGIPASVLATFVICSIGYAIMRPLGL